MEKNELNRKYELMAILDGRLPVEEKESIGKNTVEAVTKGGGKIVNSQIWLDKHKLSFRLKKSNEATYYLVNFEADSSVIPKIEPLLRLNEKILRYLISQVN